MRQYIQSIQIAQKVLLSIGIGTLIVLPLSILFIPDTVFAYSMALYATVHLTAFFVMMIRPLADIFTKTPYIRPLVILRKGFGVVSASIVVSFLIAKELASPGSYLLDMGTGAYWSLSNYALFAHLADITAVLLLITSNNFSKRVMGAWWKRLQRLSYVYFFASGLFVFLSFGEESVLIYMVLVSFFTTFAFIVNRRRLTPTVI